MVGSSDHCEAAWHWLRAQYLSRSAGRRTQEIVESDAVLHFPCPACGVARGTFCRMGWGLFSAAKITPHSERVAVEILIHGGVSDSPIEDVLQAMEAAIEHMDKSS